VTMIVEMLRKHEGVETHAYKCTANKTTIGVGRNVDPDGGIGLTDSEIDFILANDVRRVNTELVDTFKWYKSLDAPRKDALMDMCFNMGLPRLKQFKKSLAAMKANNYELAATEFLDSRWARQVGKRAITVTDMIRTGEY